MIKTNYISPFTTVHHGFLIYNYQVCLMIARPWSDHLVTRIGTILLSLLLMYDNCCIITQLYEF